MAEHDYVIANQNGANTRSDLNNALAAIVSNNSKATAPTTTYAFMWWADTANDILKQRNAADSAWISILTLSTGAPLGTLGLDSSGGVARATSGLLFNADTAAANTLDDYEEGTWTPTLYGTTTAGVVSYNVRYGSYTKIGNKVHLQGLIKTTSIGALAGVVRVGGLPFTVNSTASNYGVLSVGYCNGLAIQDAASVTGYARISETAISITVWNLTSGVSNMTPAEWSANGYMIFNVEYTT